MTALFDALMQNPAVALWIAPLIPLAAAASSALLGGRPNLREGITVAAGVGSAALAVALWPHAEAGLRVTLWDWLPGLTLAFELEPLGLLFATVASVLWPITSVYAAGYLRGNDEQHQSRFFACFALAIAAAIGIAFAANLITLFICYELLTLSTWPLVTHKGNADARKGGRTYLLILLGTSVGLLLPAIIWTYVLSGTTAFRSGGILAGQAGNATLTVLYALFLFGIGKAALMPFHRWLPAAMVAPTPVSALLHAVAVVKAGVFTVMKVSIYTFGLDTIRSSGAGELMMWVAALTMLTTAAIALTQDNLKARLAYSTISQLAYITLGAALAVKTAVLEGALHIATHAVGKITLFFCAGAIYTAAHKTRVSELDGMGMRMPYTFAAFTLASMSIVGLPPLAGSWDKLLLMEGALDAGFPLMMGVLMLGSLLSLGYLLPIPIRAFFRPAPSVAADDRVITDFPDGDPPPRPVPMQEAPLACVVPLCITAVTCVAMFFLEDRLIAPLARVLEGP